MSRRPAPRQPRCKRASGALVLARPRASNRTDLFARAPAVGPVLDATGEGADDPNDGYHSAEEGPAEEEFFDAPTGPRSHLLDLPLPMELVHEVLAHTDVLTVLKSTQLLLNRELVQAAGVFQVPLLKLRKLMLADFKRRSERRKYYEELGYKPGDMPQFERNTQFPRNVAEVLRSINMVDWKQSGAAFFFNLRFRPFAPKTERVSDQQQNDENDLIHLGIMMFQDMCTPTDSCQYTPLPLLDSCQNMPLRKFVSRMPKPAENAECFTMLRFMNAVRDLTSAGKPDVRLASGFLACITGIITPPQQVLSAFRMFDGATDPEAHIAEQAHGLIEGSISRYFTFSSAIASYELLTDPFGDIHSMSLSMTDCFVFTARPDGVPPYSQPKVNGEFSGVRINLFFVLHDGGPTYITVASTAYSPNTRPVLFSTPDSAYQNLTCLFVNPAQFQSGQ